MATLARILYIREHPGEPQLWRGELGLLPANLARALRRAVRDFELLCVGADPEEHRPMLVRDVLRLVDVERCDGLARDRLLQR